MQRFDQKTRVRLGNARQDSRNLLRRASGTMIFQDLWATIVTSVPSLQARRHPHPTLKIGVSRCYGRGQEAGHRPMRQCRIVSTTMYKFINTPKLCVTYTERLSPTASSFVLISSAARKNKHKSLTHTTVMSVFGVLYNLICSLRRLRRELETRLGVLWKKKGEILI
ncbi:uncharacterized protein LOC143359183 [Halictus rubicundus]|uniref:uncharacterized protein LOC143359183 n=1 Tax=Halictus rubicundus TaxID=77578 RepID=UPI004035FD9E